MKCDLVFLVSWVPRGSFSFSTAFVVVEPKRSLGCEMMLEPRMDGPPQFFSRVLPLPSLPKVCLKAACTHLKVPLPPLRHSVSHPKDTQAEMWRTGSNNSFCYCYCSWLRGNMASVESSLAFMLKCLHFQKVISNTS